MRQVDVVPDVKSVKLDRQVKLNYVEQGEAGATPLLLLHGFAGSWRSFERVLPQLPESIHAFALTLRGYGDASKPAGGYGLIDHAGDVAAFMEALGIERTVVAGHSMGSAVAQRLAIDYPEKTLGLILIGACVVEPGGPRVQEFWDATVSRLEDPIDPEFVREFLESTPAQPVPETTFEGMLRDSLKVPARVWKAAWKSRLEGEGMQIDLARIEAPALIVWGDQDSRCPRDDQERLQDGIVNSRLVVYRGAGHAVHEEEPERFAADVAAFVWSI